MANGSDRTSTPPPRVAGPRGSASFPQADLHFELTVAVRACHLDSAVPTAVDALVEVLQITEVGGIEALNRSSVQVLQPAEPGDHACEQDDHEVAGVAAYS